MDPSTSSDAAGAAAAAIWTLFSTMCCFAYLIPIGLGVLGMVFWIIALIDVAQRKECEFPNAMKGTPGGSEQLIWLLVVVLTGVIGAIIYYFVVMKPYPRPKHIVPGPPLTPSPQATPPAPPATPTPPAAAASPAPPMGAQPPAEPAESEPPMATPPSATG